MKKMSLTWMVAGLMTFGAFTAGSAMAEDKPEADLTVGIYSQYIWRGFAFSKDSLVVQPGMTVSYKGFGFNLWGNLDTDQVFMESESYNWNETDMTLSYDGGFGKVGYSVGYIYYDVDGADGTVDTEEIYVGLSLDTLLAPSLTVYYDIDNIPGYYVNIGISHSVPVGEKLSLDLGLSIGYLDDDADYNELHDGVISAALPIAVGEYITITPELYASFALSSDSSDLLELANMELIEEDESTFVYGGVSASIAF